MFSKPNHVYIYISYTISRYAILCLYTIHIYNHTIQISMVKNISTRCHLLNPTIPCRASAWTTHGIRHLTAFDQIEPIK